MKSEIPAMSGWLRVRWCVWAEQPFPVVHLSPVSGRVCGKRVIGAAYKPLCYPEGRAGPRAVIRLREVNTGLGDQGLTQALEMWREAKPGLLSVGAACFAASSSRSVLFTLPPSV